jgi:large subunit ribosomal protein L18
MDQQKARTKQRQRRKLRVRRKVHGTTQRPRLSVFRSSKHIYAQLIDDSQGITVTAVSSHGKGTAGNATYGGNVKAANAVGKLLAEAAKAKGIQQVAFDRGHYKYHGRIKALADGAREGGLKF